MRFRKKVPAEKRELLEKQYKEYISKVKMTSEEKHALKEWVSGGRSPFDNPDSIYTSDGYPMDFAGAMRCHDIYCDYDPFEGDVVFKAAEAEDCC